MLLVNILRQNPDEVKEKLAVKNFKNLSLVDEIVAVDDERKKAQSEFDNNQSTINSISKSIGQLMAQGKKEDAENAKKEVSGLKPLLEELKNKMSSLEDSLQNLLVQLPNLPHDKVPKGTLSEDNIVVKEGGEKPNLYNGAVAHWELIKKYDLIDFETGAKITGSGFPLFKGKGAKLQRALVQYFLDYNTDAGFTEYNPPYMVNEASAYATGQLPDKEGQMYHATEDNFYLIPTAEVPVTNIYRNEILKESDLPIRMTAHSPCFRREAGSFGKDVRGLNRVHQFEKVEIVEIVHPDHSDDVLDSMVAHVEGLLQSLELPYRILLLCGGDMSFTSHITYDFEVYSAAQEKWLEVSSVSNFHSYQANRLKCRFKNADGKTQLVHTLNGSSLALPRIIASLLENNQTSEGIKIPKVLQPYFGAEKI